jgi:O-antigen/teichoic acid export membrane protein
MSQLHKDKLAVIDEKKHMIMIGRKSIAVNTLSLILSSIFNLGISLFIVSILARSIGPELYGRYAFSLNYIMTLSIIAHFGLEPLFIREAARERANLAMINNIFHLKILIGFFTIFCIMSSAYMLAYPPVIIKALYILCIGAFFQILTESLLSVYRAIEKMHITAVSTLLFRVFSAVVIVASIYLDIGFWGIISSYSIACFIVFLIVSAMFFKDFNLLNMSFCISEWIPLLKRGLPFYLISLLTMLYWRINIIILSKTVSEKDLGFYLAALALVESLWFIPNAFVTSLSPVFARLFGSSYDELKKTYRKIMKYFLIITIPMTMGTVLISDDIVRLLYGADFMPAAPVLRVLIFYWALIFFSNTQAALLFSVNREKSQLKLIVIVCVINIALNFSLISSLGYIGSAYASLFSEGILVIMISVILWKLHIRYVPDFALLRLIPAAILMALAVKYLMDINLFVAVAAGALIYTAMLFILHVFDSDDIFYIRSMLKLPVKEKSLNN